MGYDFEALSATYAAAVERQLERAVGGERGLYAMVIEAMRYSLLGGGKRLRAMLCLEFCALGCGDYVPALPFAAAVEQVHAYSLIHDDLPCMDNDDLRRGKPACHVRYGEWGALLAGDALLTLAFESALRDCDYAALGYERAVRALALLARCAGADGMVGGQVIDLTYENSGEVTPGVLREMDALKTGALIRAACGMGAIAGGIDGERLEGALRFAGEIGLAFQIADDILDETSTPGELGKSIGKDRESGKATYATIYGLDRARQMADECVTRAREELRALGAGPFLFDLADRMVRRSR